MASVSSLDQDMKRLRMSRYTPAAAKEIRSWIEDTLGDQLPSGDLLEILKDGTILCRLANLGLPPPGIKFKKSPMPFIQMENISHFLRACENPPYNLQSHDRFLTVDLYEAKDPAQVLQCIGAFSRVSHSLFPSKFRTTIGPKRAGAMSPNLTGASNGSGASDYSGRERGFSNAGSTSPSKTGGANNRPMSSAFTGSSSILYSGYMGGASQGNQGISFGARRQITSAAPHVPSLAEKERKRKEKEIENEKLRLQSEDEERRRRIEKQEQEERAKIAEEKRWEEEAKRLREEEKKRLEQQKREWEEQERRWKEDEEARLKEEKEAQLNVEKNTQRGRGLSDPRLRGQYLSQYQAEAKTKSRQSSYNDPERLAEREKIQELERQLDEAKERERQYEEERLKRTETVAETRSKSRSRSRPRPIPRPPSPQESAASWTADEREYLRKQHTQYKPTPSIEPEPTTPQTRPLPIPSSARPLPEPTSSPAPLSVRPLPKPQNIQPPPSTSRPLPNPQSYPQQPPPQQQRTQTTPLPQRPPQSSPQIHTSPPASKPKGAYPSLLEREMQRERERQQEWEAAQEELKTATPDKSQGTGAGMTWDVNQYGYTGGDSQNRGGGGIGFGGKRQIIGPRPPP